MKIRITCFITVLLLSVSSLSFADDRMYCDVVKEENCRFPQMMALTKIQNMHDRTDELCDIDGDGIVTEGDIAASEFCLMRMMTFYTCMKTGELEGYNKIYDYRIVEDCMQKTYDHFRSKHEI